jgi:hypothetical protein
MKIFQIFLLLSSMLVLAACQDIYEPDIEFNNDFLVVEGLVTNEPSPNLVKLSRSSVFGEPFKSSMEHQAKVSITCNEGIIHHLYEVSPGHYYTDQDFVAEVGKEYSLHIETSNGESYLSAPQLLMPPLAIESFTGEAADKTFIRKHTVSGNIVHNTVKGNNVIMTVSNAGFAPKFRFTNYLLADYEVIINEFNYNRCWIRNPVTDYMNPDIGKNLINATSQEHAISFVPFASRDLTYLSFPDYYMDPITNYNSQRIVINYIYSLNDDAYAFHEARNQQLNDEGRFFDPISPQLPGNVSCLSDPSKPVLGFFEVSSLSYRPVSVSYVNGKINVESVHFVDTIPNTGCMHNQIPPFFSNLKSNVVYAK